MEIQVIAERIRSKDYWDMGSCIELCKLAGQEEEFNNADGETFESVLFEAAERLGVEII